MKSGNPPGSETAPGGLLLTFNVLPIDSYLGLWSCFSRQPHSPLKKADRVLVLVFWLFFVLLLRLRWLLQLFIIGLLLG